MHGVVRRSVLASLVGGLMVSGFGLGGAVALGADGDHPIELGRAPRLEASFRQASEQSAPRVAAAIDTSSRATVTAAYRSGYLANQFTRQAWTGSVSTCKKGSISSAWRAATLGVVNYYRGLAGLPDVAFASDLNEPSQAAALIMDANNTLTHSPQPGATCYTAQGYEGASHANLCFNCVGPRAIDAYMFDSGEGNQAVGHRRWILYPPQTTLGTGSTPQADALYVIDSGTWVRPSTAPEWISWPPPGFVPHVHIYPRFSLSHPDAGFGDATVSVTVDGGAVSAPVVSRASGYGDRAIVFEPSLGGVNLSSGDHIISVTVSGIDLAGETVSHQWQTTSFVPNVPSGSVTPGSKAFGEVGVGASSSQTFRISNNGGSAIQIGALSLGGNQPGQFGRSSDGCSLKALGPGTDCTVRVKFSPNATGSKSAELIVPSDGRLSPSRVYLWGTGVKKATTKMVDDKHQGFTRYKTGWKGQSVGWNGRSFWTTVRRASPYRYAVWRATLTLPGPYEVYVRYPKRNATTLKASYKVFTKSGIVTRSRAQKTTGARWVKLGTFDFGSVARVKLSDRTGERASSGRRVVFDVVKFVPAGPSAAGQPIVVEPEIAESALSAEAVLKLRLYPKTVGAVPGARKLVTAWTCPADDRSPYGPDREPGTSDDECTAVEADWRLADEEGARLNKRRGHKVLVQLAAEADNRLIASYEELERPAKLSWKPRPPGTTGPPLFPPWSGAVEVDEVRGG